MTQKLRVGIVGCGEVVQTMHLPSLYQLPKQFCVTALCDVSQQVVDEVGEQWRVVKRYLDYRDLLEQADVDVVLIANPNAYHAEVTLATPVVMASMCWRVSGSRFQIGSYTWNL